jgi:O-antigen/teichoic acid export membrane protein
MSTTASTPSPAPAMGRSVGGGMTWMVVTTALTRVLTFAAQIVLGWKLSEGDFGLFAYATGIAGVLMVCRDAAMRELLVQRGPGGYRRLSGSAFWLAFAYNLAVFLIIAAIAAPVSYGMFGDRSLADILWLIALSLPIGTPVGILQAKMRLEMRFAAFSAQIATMSVIRQGVTILLALWGFGSMALAIPVVVAAVFDVITTYSVCRDEPWKRPARRKVWPAMLKNSRWLMLGNLAYVFMDFGPYLLMSQVMRGASLEADIIKAIIGLYFFAYQITAQIGILLASNVQMVLMPALTLLKDDAVRQRAAALRALHALMLLASLASLGLAAVITPLEHLIWRGKWSDAVPAIIVLGVFFPWRVTFGLSSAMLMAQGRSREYAISALIEGAGLALAAGAGAIFISGDNPGQAATIVAWCTGIWLLLARLISTAWAFRGCGVPLRSVAGALFPSWLIAIVSGAAGYFADRFTNIAPIVEQALGGQHPGWWAVSAAAAAEAAIAGLTCVVVFVVLSRLLIADHVRDAVSTAPGRLRGVASRLFLLGRESA